MNDKTKSCSACGKLCKYLAKGFCVNHYQQWQRYGRILDRTRFTKNEFIDCGDFYEVILYDKSGRERVRTKISKHRRTVVEQYKWYLATRGYVVTETSGKPIQLHRLILGTKPGLVTDHINMDTLDNRDENLRFATRAENARNKPTRGVSWIREKRKWRACIMVSQKAIYLGYFDSENEARKVRRTAELKYFGEFAYKYFEEPLLKLN